MNDKSESKSSLESDTKVSCPRECREQVISKIIILNFCIIAYNKWLYAKWRIYPLYLILLILSLSVINPFLNVCCSILLFQKYQYSFSYLFKQIYKIHLYIQQIHRTF